MLKEPGGRWMVMGEERGEMEVAVEVEVDVDVEVDGERVLDVLKGRVGEEEVAEVEVEDRGRLLFEVGRDP